MSEQKYTIMPLPWWHRATSWLLYHLDAFFIATIWAINGIDAGIFVLAIFACCHMHSMAESLKQISEKL